MELLAALATRASALRLAEPGPKGGDLRLILEAGVRAPDHGKLTPWRFAVLEGEARSVLAEAMADCLLRKDPQVAAAALDGERAKPFRAPTIVAVAARTVAGHKVPEVEQIAAVAAGIENMLLAAHALGYGTMWKTGAAAYDAGVKQALGFEATDHLVGLIYLGTATASGAPRAVELDSLVRWL